MNYELNEDQIALLNKLLYNDKTYSEDSDTTDFIIPFIAMSDGKTPAQIRSQSRGLYKDIQRSPFIRKTGVFTSSNTIEDIDITALVYYGTLEQAKIAPTLENIDIKLYFREPKLHKVKDNSSNASADSYADNYIWREIPVGFHVYNNDTVYGYEWLILQDDYVGTDGIYNLHMNIEDGLGVCKFAGTQAPINLAGVQYKIIITAKSLWNREFSLLDSMPLIQSLTSNTTTLAPSVKAVRDYYAAAVETLKVITKSVNVSDEDVLYFSTDKSGTYIKELSLGDIENVESFVKKTTDDLETHTKTVIDGAVTDENNNVIGVHGIINKGAKGNIDAKTLCGASLSNGVQSVADNIDSYSYIPFVDKNDTIGYGTLVKQFKRSSGKDPVPVLQTELVTSNSTLMETTTSLQSVVDTFLKSVSVGTTKINCKFFTSEDKPTIALTSGSLEKDNVGLKVNSIETNEIDFGNDVKLNLNVLTSLQSGSTIAYKNIDSELLGIKIKSFDNYSFATLKPNISHDTDGNLVKDLYTANITDDALNVPSLDDVNAMTKLGSALQALYELPLGTYKYKRGQNEYKEQLGIFVERVNQYRDHLLELRGETDYETTQGNPTDSNVLVHRRNTYLKSVHPNIIDKNDGIGDPTKTDDYTERLKHNAYTYTDEEVKSICHYLDLMTGKKELNQEIRNTVGILLKAAKETQERLLDIETSIFGWDSKTLPGTQKGRTEFIDAHIAKDLQDQLNSSPLLLGLNRLMRAVTLELFDTTDFDKIEAEVESRVTDSDGLGEKVSIKSRMDMVDEIMNVLYSQQSAMVRFYYENVINDEGGHTYVDIVDKANNVRETSTEALEEDTDLLNDLDDNHNEDVDRDKGRTWKNLPSDDDVTTEVKEKVGFAEVADFAHKHTPNKDESGTVRIPTLTKKSADSISEGQTEHTDESEYAGTTDRTWDLFKLDKTKLNKDDDYAAYGTYKPFFKTKAVAWDTYKLQRMNLKLSEVTKTIYGTDDVSMRYPNRTEVLRRNITNLVDDLYPNRSFNIENPISVLNDSSAEMYLPFKKSRVQSPDKAIAGLVDDEKVDYTHTSIINWIDNELFNFSVTNHYIGKELISSSGSNDYANNKQVDISDRLSNVLKFTTSSLVTDNTPFSDDYGTYFKAYSRLDMLENLLGVKDCYITNLYADTILDINDDIVDNLDNRAIGYTAAQQITVQVNRRNELETLLDNLNLQKTNLNNELSTINGSIESVESQITETQAQIDVLQVPIDSETLQLAVTEAEGSYATAQQNVKDCQSDITETKANLETVNTGIDAKESEITVQKQLISDQEDYIDNLQKSISDYAENKKGVDALQESYNAFAKLNQNGTFKPGYTLKEWVDSQFTKNETTDLAEYAWTEGENIEKEATVYNGIVPYEDSEDHFDLTIDEDFKKSEPTTVIDTKHDGVDFTSSDPITISELDGFEYKDYYKDLDGVDYIDSDLKKILAADQIDTEPDTISYYQKEGSDSYLTDLDEESKTFKTSLQELPEDSTNIKIAIFKYVEDTRAYTTVKLTAENFESFENFTDSDSTVDDFKLIDGTIVTSKRSEPVYGNTITLTADIMTAINDGTATYRLNDSVITKIVEKASGKVLVYTEADADEPEPFDSIDKTTIQVDKITSYNYYINDELIDLTDGFEIQTTATIADDGSFIETVRTESIVITKYKIVKARFVTLKDSESFDSAEKTTPVYADGTSLIYNVETKKYYLVTSYLKNNKIITDFDMTDVLAINFDKYTKLGDYTLFKQADTNTVLPADEQSSDCLVLNTPVIYYKRNIRVVDYKLTYTIKYTLNWSNEDSTYTYPRALKETELTNVSDSLPNNSIGYPRSLTWTGSVVVTEDQLENGDLQLQFVGDYVADQVSVGTQKYEKISELVSDTTSILGIAYDAAGQLIGSSNTATLEKAQASLTTLNTKLEELETELSTLESEKADLTDQLSVAEVKLTEAEQAETDSLKALRLAKNNLNNVGSQNTERLAELSIKIVDLDTLNAQLSELKTQVSDLTVRLENLQTQIDETNAQLESVKEKITELEKSSTDKNVLPYYTTELSFKNFVVEKNLTGSINYDDVPSQSLIESSNVGFILSRKTKTIQERITTTEAFLDSVARTINYGTNIFNSEKATQESLNVSSRLTPNKRFEAVENYQTLKRVFDVAENKQVDSRIYDLDLSESVSGLEEHNRKVWQFVQYSRNATKGVFTLADNSDYIGFYNISNVQLAVDPSILPYQDSGYMSGWTKFSTGVIKVYYVKSGITITNPDVKTIYLNGKTPTGNFQNFYVSDNTVNNSVANLLTNSKGWQNQSEYNVYKTISNLFTSLLNNGKSNSKGLANTNQDANNLFYQLMLLAHPVGSVYMSENDTSPATLFGGTWKQIQNRYIVASSDSKPVGHEGGSNSCTLSTDNIPAHTHDKGTYNITGSINSDCQRGYGANGAFYEGEYVGDNDGYKGWSGMRRIYFSADRNWTGRSGSTGDGSPFTIEPEYHSFNIWVREA